MKKLLGLNMTPFAVMLIGVGVIYFGISKHARWERIDEGVLSAGHVADAKAEQVKGGVNFYLDVTFYPTPKTPVSGVFPVSESGFKAHAQLDLLGNARITERDVAVRYNPEDTSEGWVVGDELPRPFSKPAWIIGGLALIVLGGWMLRNVIRADSLVEDVNVGDAVKSGLWKTIRTMFRGA